MRRACQFSLLNGMKMTNDERFRPWQVWHARFNFAEGKGYKFRPVIVLGPSPGSLLVLMVTGATSKLSLEHDYFLRDWVEAGLDKPSIARADRIAEIPLSYLGSAGFIGSLSLRDIDGLRAVLQTMDPRAMQNRGPASSR